MKIVAILLILAGLVGLYVGVQNIRLWYKENAENGVTARTNQMMMGGFFVATVGLLGGISMLFLH